MRAACVSAKAMQSTFDEPIDAFGNEYNAPDPPSWRSQWRISDYSTSNALLRHRPQVANPRIKADCRRGAHPGRSESGRSQSPRRLRYGRQVEPRVRRTPLMYLDRRRSGALRQVVDGFRSQLPGPNTDWHDTHLQDDGSRDLLSNRTADPRFREEFPTRYVLCDCRISPADRVSVPGSTVWRDGRQPTTPVILRTVNASLAEFK